MMKSRLLKCIGVLVLSFWSFQSCREKAKEPIQSIEKVSPETTSPEPQLPLSDWQNLLKQGSDSLVRAYSEQAVRIKEDGNLIEGGQSIADGWLQSGVRIDSVISLYQITASKDGSIHYGIFRLLAQNSPPQTTMLIWKTEADRTAIELEFTAESPEELPYPSAIDEQREHWMQLCNAHDVEKLVTELYTSNSVYYNHRPVIVGHKAISEEYAYMNRDSYSLTLSPLTKIALTEDLAFEIGQCSGSYGGNYMLVWQKGTDRQWRVLMDSNI